MLRGASSALSRSADSVGVLVIGGFLTLLTWVVTPVWLLGALSAPALLVLAPLALAPALVARGYFVRVVADAGSNGNRDGAPSFVGWNSLYRDGLKSLLLTALLLAPLALSLALVALAAVAVGAGLVDPTPAVEVVERALGPGAVPVVTAAGGGLSAVVAAAYLLAFAYVRPAALAVLAATGRLRDALRPSRVAAVAGSGSYATAWAVALATLGAGYALAAPFVPLVVGVVLVFVVRVAAHALYGRGAAGALAFGVAEPVAAAGQSGATAAAAGPPSNDGLRVPYRGSSALDRADGGFSSLRPEVPVAVQTGRSVPPDDERDEPTDVDGFEWNRASDPDGDDGDADDGTSEDGATDGRAATDRVPADESTDSDEFEWGAGVDPEDKS